jgi:penicillin-binding protein 1B
MTRATEGPRRWLLIAAVTAASVGTLVFALWIMALDREVRTRFAGARWALPAQVYAAPLLLYPGLNLTRKAFVGELERLGYRQVPKLGGPGTYAVRRDRVELHSRPFGFWDGTQPAGEVEVDFDERQVAEISIPPRGRGARSCGWTRCSSAASIPRRARTACWCGSTRCRRCCRPP